MFLRNRYRLRRYPELATFENDQDREQAWKTCNERMCKNTKWWMAVAHALFALLALVVWWFAVWPMAFLLSVMGASGSAGVAILCVLYLLLLGSTIALPFLFQRRTKRRYLRELLAERGVPLCMQCGHEPCDPLERKCPACGRSIDDRAGNGFAWKQRAVAWGVILAMLVAVTWGFGAVGQSRLDRALEQARQLGPATYDEIARARRSWRDEENGATVIVNLGLQLDCIKEEIWQSDLPLLGHGPLLDLGRRWSAEVDQLAADELRRHSDALAQINRLIEYEGGRFPLTTAANPLDIRWPHAAHVRTAAQLKSVDIIYRAAHGDTACLREDLTIMLTLGRLLEEDPSLLCALVRVGVDALTVSTVEQVCAQGVLEPSLLRDIQGSLTSADVESRLYWGILGERACCIELFQWLRSEVHAGASGEVQNPGMRWGACQGFLYDQALCLAFWDRHVRSARHPMTGPQVSHIIVAEVQALPDVLLATKTLIPDLGHSYVRDMAATGQMRSAITALAVERYRIDHGQWPDTLDQVVPEYLASIPFDPFDGRPLRYCLVEDAAVIYSVGENLIDDGGDVGPHYPCQSEELRDCGFFLPALLRRGLPADE